MNPIVAHLVGDFILQNEWMAVNKKQSSLICTIHVLVYLLPFLFCNLCWWQICFIGIQHFLQDRTGFVFWWIHFWKRVPKEHLGNLHLFVDQSFHILWIEIVIHLSFL